jgi:hypothetical protein
MDKTGLKTEFRIQKDARELAIYEEYNALMKEPGAMATAVNQFLTQKYGFGSKTTVYFICKRIEKRLKQQEG